MKIQYPRLPELASSLFVLSAFLTTTAIAQSGPASQAPRAADASGLEEVVVTAQRRVESVQKAAVAIAVLSTDELVKAGVTEPENLNKLAPGLAIGTGGPSNQIYLRGVGSYGTNAFADPAVQFTVDGVAYGRITGLGGNFFDLQRVEVLKGPQGILYGRNATGGAINVVSNKPQKEFSAGVSAEVGNYSLRRFNAYLNVPMGEHWAARIAGQSTQRDGYSTDGTNDEDSKSGRLQVLYSTGDDLSLLLSASKVSLGGEGFAQVPYRAAGYFNNSDPYVGTQFATPALLPALFTTGVGYANGSTDVDVTSYGAQLDVAAGAAGTATLIANRVKTTTFSKNYGPGFKFWPDDDAKQTSVEGRIAGSAGALQWVGGAFWYREKQSSQYWVDQGFLFNQTGANLKALDDKTWAVFGQLTYSLSDRLRLVGGLRYTNEKKTLDGLVWTRQPQGVPCAALRQTAVTIADVAANIPQAATNDLGVAYPFTYCRDAMTGSRTWNDTSWKAGVEFDVAPDSMLYANASRGFKAGGYFTAGNTATIGNSYEPETLVAYAVGSKNTLAGGRVRLNAEAFLWDYKNHQESYLAPINPPLPGFSFVTINVPKARIYGLDVELEWAPTDADRLGVRAQYLHAEYTNFVFSTARPGEFGSGAGTQPPATVCPATLVAIANYRVNCTGQEMPRSPKVAIQADYSHTFTLPGGSTLEPSVGLQYSAKYWTAVDYNPLQRQDAFTMWDASLTWRSADRKWSVGAYGRNLGDEVVWQNSFVHPSGVAFNALRPPRTYGGRVDFRF